MKASRLVGLLALALAAWPAPARAAASPASGAHQVVGVYVVWFEGQRDDNREEVDRFLECLVEGSSLNSYWRGEAGLELRGSVALPAPEHVVDRDNADDWLTPHVQSGALPTPRADEIPVYLLIGPLPVLSTDACGRSGEGVVAGRHAGLALVRNLPLCWPTGDTLRTETQIAQHELVEATDRMLGYAPCGADGSCEARAGCPGECKNLIGLSCPGAPEASWTGCAGGQVEGWVIQRLSHEGRDPDRCKQCVTCDFTPEPCPPGRPDCAAVPPPPTPTVTVDEGCAGARAATWGPLSLVLALLTLAATRRRQA